MISLVVHSDRLNLEVGKDDMPEDMIDISASHTHPSSSNEPAYTVPSNTTPAIPYVVVIVIIAEHR